MPHTTSRRPSCAASRPARDVPGNRPRRCPYTSSWSGARRGNPNPAIFRMVLRPPSQPTRYEQRIPDLPAGDIQSTITPRASSRTAEDGAASAHIDPEGACALGQHRLDRLLVDETVAPIRLGLRLGANHGKPGEMAADSRARRPPVAGFRLRPLERCRRARFGGSERGAQAATLEGLAAQRTDPERLHREVRLGEALEHDDARPSQG